MEKQVDLEQYRVGSVDAMYYIPNYVSKEEQEMLFTKVYSSQWTTLPTTQRRLQEHGGSVNAKATFVEALPEWLQKLSKQLYAERYVSHLPNHVLINEYRAGQGIEYHTDGPLYTPSFAIISLKSSLLLEFYHAINPDIVETMEQRKVCSVLLEVFVFSLYISPSHCIFSLGRFCSFLG
jgi:alkylated DNA repair protein alkB homolog 6